MMANFALTYGMKNNDLLVEIKERLAVSQGSRLQRYLYNGPPRDGYNVVESSVLSI